MEDNVLAKNLNKACNARVPLGLMFSYDLDNEIQVLQDYLGRKYNNLPISKELEDKVSEIGFSDNQNFEDWFRKRIKFYEKKWGKITRYKGDILKNYSFFSETFKILDKCSWWVQNAYQSYSGAKCLLNELDYIAACFEKEKANKTILEKKAEMICRNEKDLRGKSQQILNRKKREKERQIFAFFAELKAANELLIHGFTNILFLQEGRSKTPDFSANRQNKIYYIEVKRIQNPREEDESLRSKGSYARNINKNFREPLKKKIGDFIYDANKKFNQQDQDKNLGRMQKVLILDFEPGIDARLSVNFTATLEEIFGNDFFENLENVHDITIWVRKYF